MLLVSLSLVQLALLACFFWLQRRVTALELNLKIALEEADPESAGSLNLNAIYGKYGSDHLKRLQHPEDEYGFLFAEAKRKRKLKEKFTRAENEIKSARTVHSKERPTSEILQDSLLAPYGLEPLVSYDDDCKPSPRVLTVHKPRNAAPPGPVVQAGTEVVVTEHPVTFLDSTSGGSGPDFLAGLDTARSVEADEPKTSPEKK